MTTDLTERIHAAVVLGFVPLVFLAIGAVLLGLLGSSPQAQFTGAAVGWAAGTSLTVRSLQRRWAPNQGYSTRTLLSAALLSCGTTLAVFLFTASWHDLASEPHPTPLMVAKDLIAAFSPFILPPSLAIVDTSS